MEQSGVLCYILYRERSEDMKVTVEQIAPERAEEVLLRCHDPKEPWVEENQSIAAGQITVNGMADGKLCRLKLADIYYFDVVDGSAFFYCQKEVFSSKQKLYEFEALCAPCCSGAASP